MRLWRSTLLEFLVGFSIAASPGATAAEPVAIWPVDTFQCPNEPLSGTLVNSGVSSLTANPLMLVGGTCSTNGIFSGPGEYFHNGWPGPAPAFPNPPDPGHFFELSITAAAGMCLQPESFFYTGGHDNISNFDGPRKFDTYISTDGFQTQFRIDSEEMYDEGNSAHVLLGADDAGFGDYADGCFEMLGVRVFPYQTGNGSFGYGGIINRPGFFSGPGMNPTLAGIIRSTGDVGAGTNVEVCHVPFPMGLPGLCAVFPEVTSSGSFTARLGSTEELFQTPPPLTFAIPTPEPLLWEVEFDGTFVGPVELTFTYDDADFQGPVDEQSLTVYRFTGVWEELQVITNDPQANEIVVQSPGFSVFALGISTTPVPAGSFVLRIGMIVAICGLAIVVLAKGRHHTV